MKKLQLKKTQLIMRNNFLKNSEICNLLIHTHIHIYSHGYKFMTTHENSDSGNKLINYSLVKL